MSSKQFVHDIDTKKYFNRRHSGGRERESEREKKIEIERERERAGLGCGPEVCCVSGVVQHRLYGWPRGLKVWAVVVPGHGCQS